VNIANVWKLPADATEVLSRAEVEFKGVTFGMSRPYTIKFTHLPASLNNTDALELLLENQCRFSKVPDIEYDEEENTAFVTFKDPDGIWDQTYLHSDQFRFMSCKIIAGLLM
jgi:hypothetical protein